MLAGLESKGSCACASHSKKSNRHHGGERERDRESQLSINVTAGAQRGVSVASEGARCTASSSSVDEELMGDSLADKLSHLINYRWFFWFVIALPAE
jgi:hypothetical protein